MNSEVNALGIEIFCQERKNPAEQLCHYCRMGHPIL